MSFLSRIKNAFSKLKNIISPEEQKTSKENIKVEETKIEQEKVSTEKVEQTPQKIEIQPKQYETHEFKRYKQKPEKIAKGYKKTVKTNKGTETQMHFNVKGQDVYFFVQYKYVGAIVFDQEIEVYPEFTLFTQAKKYLTFKLFDKSRVDMFMNYIRKFSDDIREAFFYDYYGNKYIANELTAEMIKNELPAVYHGSNLGKPKSKSYNTYGKKKMTKIGQGFKYLDREMRRR